jgi:hypothetical protein
MVVLCDGMPRSGSTWSFNVASKLIRLCDPARRTFGFYSDSPTVLRSAVRPRSSHLVIKAHYLDPSAYELCCSGDIKAIYTWRHPYDAIVSCVRIFGLSVDHWIDALRNTLRMWSFHEATGSACIVPYDAIIRDRSAAIYRIASWLGLQPAPDQANQLAQEVSSGQMRAFSQQVNTLGPSRLVRKDGYVYDRQTLLHQNHILDGRVGYGVDVLDCQQLLAIDAMLREEGFEFLCQPRESGSPASHSGAGIVVDSTEAPVDSGAL